VHAEDGVQNTLISGNVIGDNLFGGVIIDGTLTAGTRILDNFIGVAPDGTAMGNDIAGIQLNHTSHSTVAGNVISNQPVGVVVDFGEADFNTISRNSIFGNGTGLGIDIAPLGAVNPNDPGDGDSGANQQLNFPVISAADTNVSGTACRTAPSRCSWPPASRVRMGRARRSSPPASPRATAASACRSARGAAAS